MKKIKKKIKRFIDLSNIPKWKNTSNKGKYKWKESIGLEISFIYDEISGSIKIIDYKNNIVTFIYNSKKYSKSTKQIKDCNFGFMINNSKEYKYEIGDIVNNKLILEKTRIKQGHYSSKAYKYKCLECNSIDINTEYCLLNNGCPYCTNQKINETNCIATTHPHLMKYLVNKEDGHRYSHGSYKKILCKCPDCSFEKEIRILTLTTYGFSCPRCSDGISYPNKFMFNLLEQLNIKFENEYSPDWIKPKRYDFYLPDYNLIIEMDGGWHYRDNRMSGLTLNKLKDIDKYKDKLAKEHNIEVIRINCGYNDILDRFKYIKNNIMHSKLNYIFDLNNIDWLKIDKLCQKSNIKKVCDYWKKYKNIHNGHLTTKKLSEVFKTSQSRIVAYLHKGNELGWCNYNSEEEINNNFKISKMRIKYIKSKPIEVFKNDKSLGVFESLSELSRQSEKLFGVKFALTGISKTVTGKTKYYKGYNFKYITKDEYSKRTLKLT